MTAVSGQVKRPAGGRPAEEQGLLSQEKLSGQEQLDRLSGMNLNSKEAEALLKAIYDAKNDGSKHGPLKQKRKTPGDPV